MIYEQSRARKFEEMNAIEVEQMTIELAEDIKALWADPGKMRKNKSLLKQV